jgi:hypothetical protein
MHTSSTYTHEHVPVYKWDKSLHVPPLAILEDIQITHYPVSK